MAEPHPDSGTDPPIAVLPPQTGIVPLPMETESSPGGAVSRESECPAESGEFHTEESSNSSGMMTDWREVKEEPLDDEYPGGQEQGGDPEENPEEIIYCICKLRGQTEIMIGCEQCGAWMHGTCVQIDRKLAAQIDNYFCDRCIAEHGVQKTYRKTYGSYLVKKERAVKAAEARKAKKEMEKAMNDFKLGNKDEIKEEPIDGSDLKFRNPRCEECIHCATRPDCGKCNYCRAGVGRCIKIPCVIEEMNKRKQKAVEPPPLVSPKGSTKRKNQRKRKSGGDSDDDELFLSESTSTRKILKAKKKRGRKMGWRKSVDGKGDGKKEEEEIKKEISRVGKNADFDKQNGPENAQFDRPGYDTTVGERLDLASSAYAAHVQSTGQITENKRGKCKNESCGKERRDQDNYCGEECGMMAAQAHLQKAGILATPVLANVVLHPKKQRSYKAKKAENDENKRIEKIAAQQEADYLERKRRQEAEKDPDEEIITDDTDLVAATIRRMQRDAAKSQRELDEQRQIQEVMELQRRQEAIMEEIKRKEAEDREKRRQEAEEKDRKRQEAAEVERKRAEAEAQYRALTSYMPVGGQNVLENAIHQLLAQAAQNAIIQHQQHQSTFFPGAFFNPLLNPLNFGHLTPSFPNPILPSINTAMMDHNDYLLQPILPLHQHHSSSSLSNSTPSTLSNPSPAAPSPFVLPHTIPTPSPLVFNPSPPRAPLNPPPAAQFPMNTMGDADALSLLLNFTNQSTTNQTFN